MAAAAVAPVMVTIVTTVGTVISVNPQVNHDTVHFWPVIWFFHFGPDLRELVLFSANSYIVSEKFTHMQ
jgi:hypothetical protein